MTHLDLFSGIGGFALAARWCGITTIGFSETDEYCAKILNKHWPGVPNYGDIRTMRGVPCDLITGGFPCQPYSLAGKRGGSGDDRALWPEMRRIIAESKPRWVLGENVPGIISLELDRVLSDLEGLGYFAWPVVIPACAVDARHRRSRVWIVAHAECVRSRTSGENQEPSGKPEAFGGGGENVAYTGSVGSGAGNQPNGSGVEASDSGEDVANPKGTELQGERASAWEGRPESGHCCWWEPEPQLGRVANGIPNRVDRLRGLGNAIVPQVAYQLLKTMTHIDTQLNRRREE